MKIHFGKSADRFSILPETEDEKKLLVDIFSTWNRMKNLHTEIVCNYDAKQSANKGAPAPDLVNVVLIFHP
jgi:hypothetical protein